MASKIRGGPRDRRMRERIYARFGNRCVYCGAEHNLTLDHIIPISRGGANVQENLQPLCEPCNNWKGDKLESEL